MHWGVPRLSCLPPREKGSKRPPSVVISGRGREIGSSQGASTSVFAPLLARACCDTTCVVSILGQAAGIPTAIACLPSPSVHTPPAQIFVAVAHAREWPSDIVGSSVASGHRVVSSKGPGQSSEMKPRSGPMGRIVAAVVGAALSGQQPKFPVSSPGKVPNMYRPILLL